MRIDGGRPGSEAHGTQRVDQSGVDRTTKGGRHADTGADSVALSPDAQLARTAAQAAQDAPEIRLDKVEAAKKALQDGRVGHDAHALADKIIDNMLER
jgi:flagellar biosynthesis anti-sigma factor FlgM